MLSIIKSIIIEYETYFNHKQIFKNLWTKLSKEEQEKSKIFFDLENDDDINNRVIKIRNNRYLCQLCQAGGDWEVGVYYFRCQLDKGYTINNISQYNEYGGCFVYIPGKNSNLFLIEKDDKLYTPNNNDLELLKEEREKIKKLCWKELNQYLENITKDI